MNDADLAIVEFCAIECELQQSGERSVWWMIEAWHWALRQHGGDVLNEVDVLTLGALIEPMQNRRGYRQCNVEIRGKNAWLTPYEQVPRSMDRLLDAVDTLTPEEWFRHYEEVHPFVDGNGRSGQILFNWLNGTLGNPVWAPDFWGDTRRTEGNGAPASNEAGRSNTQEQAKG